MYISYFLACQKANCSGYKIFKIDTSFYDSSAKYLLFLEEKCRYSFVCSSCKIVNFLDLDEIINKGTFDFLQKERIKTIKIYQLRCDYCKATNNFAQDTEKTIRVKNVSKEYINVGGAVF